MLGHMPVSRKDASVMPEKPDWETQVKESPGTVSCTPELMGDCRADQA